VFKPPADSASLPASIENFFSVLGLGFSMGDVTSGGVFAFFWLMLPGPGRQPNEPFFWLKVFWNLGYHPSLRALDWLSSIYGVKIMAQKQTLVNVISPQTLTLGVLYTWQ